MHLCLIYSTRVANRESVSILIINVYLPTDYGTIESTTTFRETIAELEGFLLTQSYDYVFIAGDFNVDFAKASRYCTILETFMQTFDLVRGDTSSDITFIYRRDDQSSSWVDHIICSSVILSTIGNVMSSDSVDNFSCVLYSKVLHLFIVPNAIFEWSVESNLQLPI